MNFKGAIVAIEGLSQVLLVVRIGAPLVLVRPAEDTKCLTIVRVLDCQGVENRLGAGGGPHLSKCQGQSLFKPVISRMHFQRGAGGVVGREKFPGRKRALHKGMDCLDIVDPLGLSPPQFVKSDGGAGRVGNFRQVGHEVNKQRASPGRQLRSN